MTSETIACMFLGNGEQYVAVAAGGESLWGFRQGGRSGGFGLADKWRTACNRWFFFAGCHGVQTMRGLTNYERGE